MQTRKIFRFCQSIIDSENLERDIAECSDYKEIINNIVNSYFIQIQNAVDTFNSLNTVIYNVVPPIQTYNTTENPTYPYLGIDDERKAYVLYFNEKLKHMCMVIIVEMRVIKYHI